MPPGPLRSLMAQRQTAGWAELQPAPFRPGLRGAAFPRAPGPQWFARQGYFSRPSRAPDEARRAEAGDGERIPWQSPQGSCFDHQSSPSGHRREPARRPGHAQPLSPRRLAAPPSAGPPGLRAPCSQERRQPPAAPPRRLCCLAHQSLGRGRRRRRRGTVTSGLGTHQGLCSRTPSGWDRAWGSRGAGPAASPP